MENLCSSIGSALIQIISQYKLANTWKNWNVVIKWSVSADVNNVCLRIFTV